MQISVEKKVLLIAAANLRHNSLFHIILSTLLLLIAPWIFGTANLDIKTAALPLEMFVALIGIVLLTPVFLPEQPKEISDVVEARATDPNCVILVRICTGIVCMLLLIAGFVLYLMGNGCTIEFLPAVFGTFAGALFLGSLGMLGYCLGGNIATGYMLPMVVFIMNLFAGRAFFGKLYILSMSTGSFTEKYWLAGAGVLLILLALFIKSAIRKRR